MIILIYYNLKFYLHLLVVEKLSFSVCVCVCVCYVMCMCLAVCVCIEARHQCWVFSSVSLYHFFETGSLTGFPDYLFARLADQ